MRAVWYAAAVAVVSACSSVTDHATCSAAAVERVESALSSVPSPASAQWTEGDTEVVDCSGTPAVGGEYRFGGTRDQVFEHYAKQLFERGWSISPTPQSDPVNSRSFVTPAVEDGSRTYFSVHFSPWDGTYQVLVFEDEK